MQRVLAEGPEAVEAQIAGVLQDVQNNRLDNPDVDGGRTNSCPQVRGLGQERLPAVQSSLIYALKEAQVAAGKPSAASRARN